MSKPGIETLIIFNPQENKPTLKYNKVKKKTTTSETLGNNHSPVDHRRN